MRLHIFQIQGQIRTFSGARKYVLSNLLAHSWRALPYRGQNVGNQCLWFVLENLRIRAVSRPFFGAFLTVLYRKIGNFAHPHTFRSIQLGIERDISGTGF
jgi:hypothetical protein